MGPCDGRVVITRSSISGKLMSNGIVDKNKVASDGTLIAATHWSGDESDILDAVFVCFFAVVRTLGKASSFVRYRLVRGNLVEK